MRLRSFFDSNFHSESLLHSGTHSVADEIATRGMLSTRSHANYSINPRVSRWSRVCIYEMGPRLTIF